MLLTERVKCDIELLYRIPRSNAKIECLSFNNALNVRSSFHLHLNRVCFVYVYDREEICNEEVLFLLYYVKMLLSLFVKKSKTPPISVYLLNVNCCPSELICDSFVSLSGACRSTRGSGRQGKCQRTCVTTAT